MNFFLWLSLLLTVAVSCSEKQETGQCCGTYDGKVIEFDVRLFPLTRAGVDEDYYAHWEEGDAIGLFAVEFGKELSSSGNVLDNAKLVFDGEKWLLNEDPDALWPENNALDFYAYYPYDSSVTDPTALSFSVSLDQENLVDFNHSNLMTGQIRGLAYGAPVVLMMSHVFSLVEVTYPLLRHGNDDIRVEMYDVCPEVTLNLASGETVQTQNTGDIALYPYETTDESYIYRAWIPSQTKLAGDYLFRYTYSGWFEKFDGELEEDIEFEDGFVTRLSESFVGYIPMVRITAGEFVMGTPEDEDGYTSREQQHRVSLSDDFYICSCEITNYQYCEFLNDTGVADVSGDAAEISADVDGYGRQMLFQKNPLVNVYFDYDENMWVPVDGKDDIPITFVSWYGAKAFADWVGGMLPTEAQWEYVCRAGTVTPWSFGDDPDLLGDYAWCDTNSGGGPGEVGVKLPNAWGVYDMHGNVYEWVNDWYDDYYGLGEIDPDMVYVDPVGPASGFYKIMRGGSWFNYWYYCRSGYRNVAIPAAFSDIIGFRVIFPVN